MFRPAFTLIELLVVVTIIVLLLALLTPALDKAIYRAELLRCATNLKGTATGVTAYATNFKRAYPYRPMCRGMNGNPYRLNSNGAGRDVRPQLRPYLSINGHLLDPFAPVEVDLDNSDNDTLINSGYNLFFGVQYTDTGGGGTRYKGMLRLGDKLEWMDGRYGALATDFDLISMGGENVSYMGHPDFQGAARPQFVQDESDMDVGGNKSTYSRWIHPGPRRPPIDYQYVLDDGSVGLFEQITWDEPVRQQRTAKVPYHCNAQSYTGGIQWISIPKF